MISALDPPAVIIQCPNWLVLVSQVSIPAN